MAGAEGPGFDAGQISMDLLGRAIAVLEVVSTGGAPHGVSALARQLGLPKSTTHRLLRILTRHELVTHGPDGYVPGPGMRRLARLAHDRTADHIRHTLMPYLVDLYERTGDVVALGILNGPEVVILEYVRGLRHDSPVPPSSELPAHCSAIGKLLLAVGGEDAIQRLPATLKPATPWSVTNRAVLAGQLPGIRRQGMAVCSQEYLPGLLDVAMPVFDGDSPVAGLSRMRPVGTVPTPADTTIHRQVALAASAALRERMVALPRPTLPRPRPPTVLPPEGGQQSRTDPSGGPG
jgi:DNA-binding IclR family transcriptional regulator